MTPEKRQFQRIAATIENGSAVLETSAEPNPSNRANRLEGYMHSSRKCTIDGCARPHHARGRCRPHYDLAKKTPGLTGRVCSIPGCGAAHFGRDYCRKHFERNRKFGSPHVVTFEVGLPLAVRLARNSERVGDCIEWTATRAWDGYGVIDVRGKQYKAHRISYEVHFGPIPAGLIVRHRCDNRPCVNPEHLEIGTHADNTRDAIERGRIAVGEDSGSARLTNDEARDIYRRGISGESGADLARSFGVGESTVYRILRGQAWSAITGAKGDA